jgi:putative serine protease XkdF
VGLPFAGFQDFEACVAANSDKSDPKAYCGALQAETEKLAKQFSKAFGICKVDDEQRMVFGWASVSQDANGQLLKDLQGDLIEPAELEKAVYDFVFYEGTANEMHRGRAKGHLVESLMVTPDKLQAMRLKADGAPQAGWWVGFKLEPDAFAKVKSGAYTMFSIEGESDAVEVAA